MLIAEPLPLYEAFSFLQNTVENFSEIAFLENLKIRHPSCCEQYSEYGKRLAELNTRLSTGLSDELISTAEKLFTPLSNSAKANKMKTPCLCKLFTDSTAAFCCVDYKEFKDYLYAFSKNVPALIVENVTGTMPLGECTASTVFDAVTASALPQRSKNNIIAAALNPAKFIDSFVDLLIPIAEEFVRCKDIWSPFIDIFKNDYNAPDSDSESELMRKKFDYVCEGKNTFVIYPSITAFYHCEIFTSIPETGESKKTTAFVGVLYDTFQRQSENADTDEAEVSRLMSILGEPSRFKIMLRLMNGPAYVGELAKCINLAPCTVSQHIGVLSGAKLVSSVDSGRRVYLSVNHEKVDKFVDTMYSMLKSK